MWVGLIMQTRSEIVLNVAPIVFYLLSLKALQETEGLFLAVAAVSSGEEEFEMHMSETIENAPSIAVYLSE